MLRSNMGGAPWPVQAVTAAGTTLGTATQITARVSNVTAAAGQTGVVLPQAQPGAWYVVFNSSATSVVVYAASGDEFIVAAAGESTQTIAEGFSSMFIATDDGQWMVFRSV